MNEKSKYYKEIIKSRMFKSATSIWGVRNIDSFDPLVKLLIESLASEINKLSNELENIEARLLERIAGVLTPDVLMTVRPSHLILHAKPAESSAVLKKTSGFYYKTKEAAANISFYPADDFNLVKGDIKSIISARKVYTIDNNKSKEICARSVRKSEKFTNKLWIGLDFHHSVTSVQNLSFYFDLPNIEKKNELLHLLPYTQWEYEGAPLSVKPGMDIRKNYKKNYDNSPLTTYDLANLSDESIINSYNYQYITLTSNIVNSDENKKILPDELDELFPNADKNGSMTPLLWVKVTFPSGFDDYILDDFFVSINTFPVINKQQYSKYLKTGKMASVIPLETGNDEFFLSMGEVTDSNNRRYMHLPFKDSEKNTSFGTYILKRGGAERFDSRNAKEYLSNLIDVLREENIAFAMFGKGFVDELVNRINTELASIELKLNELHINRDISSYIVIDSNDVGDTVYIDYWGTNCERANGIKSGIQLFPLDKTHVETESIVTLTVSHGGKRLQNNALDMYKYLLTCRDRIYTEEDIVNFCYAQFGDVITSATVKKGIRVSPRPKEGLIRSIDLHIVLKDEIGAVSKNRQDIEDRLLLSLKSKSPEIYNYRVFILKNNKQI
jgi:hypothetical protein